MTITARGVVTGAAMLQLIAEHAGLAPRDFETGAWLDKLDPALDITARDIVTGAYIEKLNLSELLPDVVLFTALAAAMTTAGDYQVFTKNAIHPVFGNGFTADLADNWQDLSEHFIEVKLMIPANLADGQFVGLSFAQSSVVDMPSVAKAYFQILGSSTADALFELRIVDANNQNLYIQSLPTLAAGSEITLYFHRHHLRAVYEVGQVSHNLNSAEADALWALGTTFNVIVAHESPAGVTPAVISAQVVRVAALTELPPPILPI